MHRITRPGYSFTLSATGDEKHANYYLTVFKETGESGYERLLVQDQQVPVDGEHAGHVEYVREVLMRVVESF